MSNKVYIDPQGLSPEGKKYAEVTSNTQHDQPSNSDNGSHKSAGPDIVIKGHSNVTLLLEPQTVHRIVIVNCHKVHLDLRDVKFAAAPKDPYEPMVEIRGGTDNTVSRVTHKMDYSQWGLKQWRVARRGILIKGGKNNLVKDVLLRGVSFGVELMGKGAKAKRIDIKGFSYDAIRMTASYTSLDGATIADAYLGNPKNHSDAVQLFPEAKPKEMHKFSLKGISVKNVKIQNDSSRPNQNWMQGVFLTDGRIYDSHFENITVNSDHQHGLSLAEAHNCVLKNITCHSPDPKIVSHISLNTKKKGYKACRDIHLKHCQADLIFVD